MIMKLTLLSQILNYQTELFQRRQVIDDIAGTLERVACSSHYDFSDSSYLILSTLYKLKNRIFCHGTPTSAFVILVDAVVGRSEPVNI